MSKPIQRFTKALPDQPETVQTFHNRRGTTPPIYRPSVSALPKMASPPVYKLAPARPMPPPPVYRPQTPGFAQAKAGVPVRSAGAPPVYQPGPAKLMSPPAVYRPQAAVLAQAKASVVGRTAGAPLVYRVAGPVSQPRALHPGLPQSATPAPGINHSYRGPFHAGVIQQSITVGNRVYTATEALQLLEDTEDLDSEILHWMDDENSKFDTLEKFQAERDAVRNTLNSSEDWARGIRKIAESIVREYPPQEYIYVGLGRSPSSLVAYLSSNGYQALTLPLGGLKLAPGKTMSKPMPDLSKAEKAALKSLIDTHIPSYDQRGGKKILLLDYVQSGEGLRIGKKLVKELIKTPWNVRRQGKVVPLALHVDKFLNPQQLQNLRNATLRPKALPGSLDEENSLAALIGGSKLKPFAEHYRLTYNQAKTGQTPVANPLYGRMLETLEGQAKEELVSLEF
jgi:hypothetical protein